MLILTVDANTSDRDVAQRVVLGVHVEDDFHLPVLTNQILTKYM